MVRSAERERKGEEAAQASGTRGTSRERDGLPLTGEAQKCLARCHTTYLSVSKKAGSARHERSAGGGNPLLWTDDGVSFLPPETQHTYCQWSIDLLGTSFIALFFSFLFFSLSSPLGFNFSAWLCILAAL